VPPTESVTVPALEARGVSHRFAEREVLHDVSLTLANGEIVAVVGPSGCGKTTLLRTCAGLLAPSHGTIRRNDPKVGFVFQEPALLAWRRVGGNAALLAEDDATVEQLLRISGLAEHRHKWPYQLSGGMKMRLSLVRTLAARPQLVLLDEPFGALDQLTRYRLHDEFLRLHTQQRFTALMVTHAIDEAVYLADRIVVMSGAPGSIVAEFVVPTARPREPPMRYDAAFAALCGRIAACLGDHP